MVETKQRIYYADLGGEWTSDKYAVVCQICQSGSVFGLLANKDEFPAHQSCIDGLMQAVCAKHRVQLVDARCSGCTAENIAFRQDLMDRGVLGNTTGYVPRPNDPPRMVIIEGRDPVPFFHYTDFDEDGDIIETDTETCMCYTCQRSRA